MNYDFLEAARSALRKTEFTMCHVIVSDSNSMA